MTYRERPTAVPGAVLWERTVGPASELTRILPDGCLDLVWDGRRLFVAGPDSTARLHHSRPSTRYVGLRFSGGTGPALLGLPANLVCDRAPDLDELWTAAEAGALAERVAAAPDAGLRRGRSSAPPTATSTRWALGSSGWPPPGPRCR